jgi:hypothetical protein
MHSSVKVFLPGENGGKYLVDNTFSNKKEAAITEKAFCQTRKQLR